MTRRQLILGPTATAAVGVLHALLPPWALGASFAATKGVAAMSGKLFDLEIAETSFSVDGRVSRAITVNGQLPAPLLRWREGDDIVLRVTNRLDEDTSIHWHGILVPFQMDGVPGVSFPGIKPGETFEYKFRVPQNGTYWYHSHSGLQEQIGHYGPIVIEPKDSDPIASDREYVVVLSDWPSSSAERVFAKLKKQSGNFNFQKRTIGNFFRDASNGDFKQRMMWGRMRMSPTDIADVTGAEYTYLVNGHSPTENWTALFEPGERVRLRIINASAMTLFDVRVPELPMTIVQADGLNVKPVETDEFQIGVAETYDVIVRPERAKAFTLMCESIDRSGYARATLSPRAGMSGPIPPRRPRPLLTMKDMGMAHRGAEGADHMNHGAMPAANPSEPSDSPAAADQSHAGHRVQEPIKTDPHAAHRASGTPPASQQGERSGHAGHGSPSSDPHTAHSTNPNDSSGMSGAMQTHHHPRGPGVQSVAMMPSKRINEPGTGLEDVPHRTLTYAQLGSLEPNPDLREPGREIELHLTSNMERYMWSFDGVKFSNVVDPIVFYKDERVRLTMVNDTMMPHPIHLHGMFFDVVTDSATHKPRKHTIIVKPAERVSVDITADAPGDWAFHCHLLYHMNAGMFQVVSVRPSGANEARS